MKKIPHKKLTKEPSQAEVVTFALYRLGGAQKAIDTEDIAIEAHRLAPGRFSWRRYPDQINLELIRVYLSDAKLKHELLLGSGKTGWRLTQHGLNWSKSAEGQISPQQSGRTRAQSRSGSIEEQRWRRERARILGTRAWQLWNSGQQTIPLAEAKEVFRVDSYARGDLLEAKLTRLSGLFADDKELKSFLENLTDLLRTEQSP
jgi:hypothetical protein